MTGGVVGAVEGVRNDGNEGLQREIFVGVVGKMFRGKPTYQNPGDVVEWLAGYNEPAMVQRYQHYMVKSNPTIARERPEEIECSVMLYLKALEASDLYYVSPAITELISSSAATLSTQSFIQQDIPSDGGFVWFANAIPLAGSSFGGLRGFCWTLSTLMPRAQAKADYYFPGESKIAEGDDDEIVEVSHIRGPNPPAVSTASRVVLHFWMEGEEIPPVPVTLLRPSFGIPWDDDEGSLFTSEDHRVLVKKKMSVALAFFLFIQQRILTAERTSVSRSVIHRMERAGHVIPTTRTVVLRTTLSRDRKYSSERSEPIDWQFQWFVRGHWRQHWYSTRQEHRPKWIMPHRKGPADKPLRGVEKVFAVIR